MFVNKDYLDRMGKVIGKFNNFTDGSNNYCWLVFVNSSDRDLKPHCHVVYAKNDEKTIFYTRVRLDKAEYFSDEDKFLPKNILIDFNSFMKAKHHIYNGTNFEFARYVWNNIMNVKFEITIKEQCNYNSMNFSDNCMWLEPQYYGYLFESSKPAKDWNIDLRELTEEETGLATSIWLDNTEQFQKNKLMPIVIVAPSTWLPEWPSCLIPVSISENPKILISVDLFKAKNELKAEYWNAIFDFIYKNCDLLLAHWNGTLENDSDIIHLIKKSQYTGEPVHFSDTEIKFPEFQYQIEGQINLFADEE